MAVVLVINPRPMDIPRRDDSAILVDISPNLIRVLEKRGI
jgi:hypothetical protein